MKPFGSLFRDIKLWLVVVITLLGWSGNYFTMAAKLDRVIADSGTHVPRTEYAQRIAFHEKEIAQNYAQIEKVSDYLQTQYPAWSKPHE